MKRTMGYLAVGVLLLVVVAAVLLFTPAGERPLERLFAVGDLAPFDFAASDLADEPNQFLMCPPGLCRAAPHAESPLFEVPVEALSQHWQDVAAAAGRPAWSATSPSTTAARPRSSVASGLQPRTT